MRGIMSTPPRRLAALVSTIRTQAVTSVQSVSRYDTPAWPVEVVESTVSRPTILVVSGLDAGKMVDLEGSSLIVGRGDEADLRVEDAAVSRAHARFLRSHGGSFHVEDLGSTNGTFWRSRRINVAPLTPGDHVQLGPWTLLRFGMSDPADERLQSELYEASIRDPLPKVFNRRYLLGRLAADVEHARRHGAPLAGIMLDVDHFKQFNDRHGHFVGDRILCFVTARLLSVLRAGDVLARFGGDEFVVLSRDTDTLQGIVLAERLRGAVSAMPLSVGAGPVSVTLSIGVGSLGELDDDATSEELVDLIDRRLGMAKSQGRNRVYAGASS
jgi:diguanylate cyclase (GGDEF)-like protein